MFFPSFSSSLARSLSLVFLPLAHTRAHMFSSHTSFARFSLSPAHAQASSLCHSPLCSYPPSSHLSLLPSSFLSSFAPDIPAAIYFARQFNDSSALIYETIGALAKSEYAAHLNEYQFLDRALESVVVWYQILADATDPKGYRVMCKMTMTSPLLIWQQQMVQYLVGELTNTVDKDMEDDVSDLQSVCHASMSLCVSFSHTFSLSFH